MSGTLHTLNAARVIAEYVVVHAHLSTLFDANGLFTVECAKSLMSFFFVLSGFVAMYCNMDVDFSNTSNALDYIKRRFKKTYPFYLTMILVDLPGAIITRRSN
jgi:peptidoglycan/LPS O-acetylase OafA/YrhL